MLPSPSLGPPLLSASRSPAVGPCGIPDDAPLDDADEDAEEAGAAADEDAPEEDFEDEDEPPPHPAAAKASATRTTAGSRRSK
jgi:hypothetical protein